MPATVTHRRVEVEMAAEVVVVAIATGIDKR
jgi:hypothetical protein